MLGPMSIDLPFRWFVLMLWRGIANKQTNKKSASPVTELELIVHLLPHSKHTLETDALRALSTANLITKSNVFTCYCSSIPIVNNLNCLVVQQAFLLEVFFVGLEQKVHIEFLTSVKKGCAEIRQQQKVQGLQTPKLQLWILSECLCEEKKKKDNSIDLQIIPTCFILRAWERAESVDQK